MPTGNGITADTPVNLVVGAGVLLRELTLAICLGVQLLRPRRELLRPGGVGVGLLPVPGGLRAQPVALRLLFRRAPAEEHHGQRHHGDDGDDEYDDLDGVHAYLTFRCVLAALRRRGGRSRGSPKPAG